MASQVLSGSGNLSYVNTTGEVVRVIINSVVCSSSSITVNWGASGSTATATAQNVVCFGKNIASKGSTTSASASQGTQNSFWSVYSDNLVINTSSILSGYNGISLQDYSINNGWQDQYFDLPTEIYLNQSETFSISSTGTISGYNVVIIPSNG